MIRTLGVAGVVVLVVATAPFVTSSERAAAAGTGTWGHTDFDGDGDDELVIAVPSESVGTIQDAGAVTVLNGSAAGTTTSGAQLWSQGTAGVTGTPATGDRFGESWAGGDFDDDGFDDLAIGIPGDTVKGLDAGRVQVLFGSDDGLMTGGQQLLQEVRSDTPQNGDLFGSALAAGDFDGDGDADLAVGAPGEEVGGDDGAGAVFLHHGKPAGLATAAGQWNQARAGVAGVAEPGDAFGATLTAGRAGRSNHDDLVVGVPREDVGNADNTGTVQVLYGSGASFSTSTDQLFTLNDFEEGLGGGAASEELSNDDGDRFGTSLALTEQGGTLLPVLIAGAPFDDDPGTFFDPAADVGSIGVLVGDDGASLTALGGRSPGGLGDPDDAVPGQRFGRSLTGLSPGYYAVSWPGRDMGSATDTGLVSVHSWHVDDEGTSTGEVRERQTAVGEGEEDDDEFGLGLWSADVDGDGDAELAIGWRESFQDDDIIAGRHGGRGLDRRRGLRRVQPVDPGRARDQPELRPLRDPGPALAAEPTSSHPATTSNAPTARNARSQANGASRSSRTWCSSSSWWSTTPSTRLNIPQPMSAHPQRSRVAHGRMPGAVRCARTATPAVTASHAAAWKRPSPRVLRSMPRTVSVGSV